MALPSKNSDDMSENQELAVEITGTNDPALGGFPQLIQPVKQIALKHLQKNIKALFSNIDDSMFEYADKADSNQQQSTYFEAMRQLRLEKKSVAQQYFKVFDKYFVDALNGIKHHGSSEEATTDDFSYTSLSLLEEDDLEESLAFTNMIEKSYGLYREHLQALVQRINHVIETVEITSDTNPVSPDNICRAFEQAAEQFSIDLEIKLIVYKMFEKQVVCQLEDMYKEINDMFVAAGVLPTIKFKGPVKSESQEAKPKPAQVKPQSPASNNEQVSVPDNGDVSFDALRQLLSMQRGQSSDQPGIGPGADTSGGQGGDGGSGGSGGGGYYVTDDVLSGLTKLQDDFIDVATGEPKYTSVNEIKENLLSALGKDLDGDVKGIENDESDVIDIVSMMFEFILEDKSLSDRIRA